MPTQVDRTDYYQSRAEPVVGRNAVQDRRRHDLETRDPDYGRGDYRDDRDRYGDRGRCTR